MKLALGFVSGISITGFCVLRLLLDSLWHQKKKVKKGCSPVTTFPEGRRIRRPAEGQCGVGASRAPAVVRAVTPSPVE